MLVGPTPVPFDSTRVVYPLATTPNSYLHPITLPVQYCTACKSAFSFSGQPGSLAADRPRAHVRGIARDRRAGMKLEEATRGATGHTAPERAIPEETGDGGGSTKHCGGRETRVTSEPATNEPCSARVQTAGGARVPVAAARHESRASRPLMNRAAARRARINSFCPERMNCPFIRPATKALTKSSHWHAGQNSHVDMVRYKRH